MRKYKGLVGTMFITMLLIGSVTLTWGNVSINQGNNLENGGGFTILQDGNPEKI